MGVGRPIYAESLEAAPASWAAPADYRDDDYFKMLTEERMIGGPLERAIEDLGDYGVKADIMAFATWSRTDASSPSAYKKYRPSRPTPRRDEQNSGCTNWPTSGAPRQYDNASIRANARERLLQLVDEDSERGELAWRHRTHRRQRAPLPRDMGPYA